MSKRFYRIQRSKLLALVIVVLLFFVVGGTWFYMHKDHTVTTANNHSPLPSPLSKIDYSPSTKQENAANNARKNSQNPSQTLDNGPTAPSADTSINPTIVNASVNSGNIHIGTLVSGTTSGTCTLTFSQTGQSSVTRTSTVKQDVNDYDCGVFNVSTSELPSGGQWTVTLSVTNGNYHGSTSTKVSG